MRYFVESYGGDGITVDPEIAEHENIVEAMKDAAVRLGRAVPSRPEWMPSHGMQSAGIPEKATPVGAWHESERELCGGVAIWREAR
jgi:hypothetical protein